MEADGLFGEAARGTCADGECYLKFEGMRPLRALAVPLYTPSEDRGPGGELALAAILEPLEANKPKRKSKHTGLSLFD
jgi:hypothetical protein